ncbi:unnamed protein product [Caenorhabditis auriculariae]|uniref:NADP-dependent oxidoreductase domain-containing protein n=1 Tax=Caenorhabditis auriculariae TaxID=2777116 RepID=A0A8S1HRY2_9PELO|nr:unnamed protein product [Caenorhabditis auriculariae]
MVRTRQSVGAAQKRRHATSSESEESQSCSRETASPVDEKPDLGPPLACINQDLPPPLFKFKPLEQDAKVENIAAPMKTLAEIFNSRPTPASKANPPPPSLHPEATPISRRSFLGNLVDHERSPPPQLEKCEKFSTRYVPPSDDLLRKRQIKADLAQNSLSRLVNQKPVLVPVVFGNGESSGACSSVGETAADEISASLKERHFAGSIVQSASEHHLALGLMVVNGLTKLAARGDDSQVQMSHDIYAIFDKRATDGLAEHAFLSSRPSDHTWATALTFNAMTMPTNVYDEKNVTNRLKKMQSHTFTRARGVPVYMNGSVSQQRLYDRLSEPSTSRGVPRSASLAPPGLRNGSAPDPTLPPTYVPKFHDEAAVRRMTYRRVPGTDMYLSKISFGAAPIGGMFGNVEDSITQIVETAIRQGINYIDTGYWYSQSRSESILGKALSKIPRRSYYISTKVGRFELDYARTFDFRADRILQSLTSSLKRLQLTYVDICYVQIHDADFQPNESIVLYETLQALQMAKCSGKIRHIGITGYPLNKLASIIACSTVKIDIVMTYCHGTLNNNSLGQFTSWFQARNVAVVNSGALCWGLLTEKGPPPWHPANDLIREACLAATTYCSSKNISIAKLALENAINFPGCISCLVGMDAVQQVKDNIELCTNGQLTSVEQRVRDRIMRRYLDRLENAGWEGVDVAQYWKKLKKLGLTALATHRHSSVESLASTLNGFSLHSSPSSSELRTPRRRQPF